MICDVHKALIYRTAIITVEKWHIAASTLYNAAYASRSDILMKHMPIAKIHS